MTALEKAKQFLESQSTGLLQERATYFVRKFPDTGLTGVMIEVLTDRGWEVPAYEIHSTHPLSALKRKLR